MNCKKCGFSNPEGASFCVSCGSRVDGKVACPKCGSMNDSGYVFCPTCGARTDGKTVCSKCGSAYEGRFCPMCGNSAVAKEVAATAVKPAKAPNAQAAATDAKQEGTFAKICKHVSAGAWLAAAAFALIFVFLIGVVPIMGGVTMDYDGLNLNFFYYFGDYFDTLPKGEELEALELLDNGASARIMILGYLPGILCALIAAASMICAVVFASIAIYKFVMAYVKKTENESKKWAIATIVTFLTGAVLFYMMNAELLEGRGIEKGCVFNGGTTAGIVLIAIFGIIAIVSGMIRDIMANGIKGKIPALVWYVLGLAFTGVLLGVAKGTMFTVAEEGDSAGYGFSKWLYSLNEGWLMLTDEELLSSLRLMNIFGTLAQLAVLAVGFFAAMALYDTLRDADHRKSLNLTWAILSLVGSGLVLVLTILTASQYSELMGGEEIEVAMGMPICCIIFSILTLVVAIARVSIINKRVKALYSDVQ